MGAWEGVLSYLLNLRKTPALSELFRPAKTDFSAVNVPTGTFPSDKISFNSSEASSARDGVLRKSSKLNMMFKSTTIYKNNNSFCLLGFDIITVPGLYVTQSNNMETKRLVQNVSYRNNGILNRL